MITRNNQTVKVALKRTIWLPFHWADAAGIMFFSHVFTLAHDTYEQFIVKTLGIPWKQWFADVDHCVPLKHVTANYHQPLQVGQTCRAELLVREVRTSSFLLNCCIYQDDALCCGVEMLHVYCTKANQQKVALPAEVKQALEAFYNGS